MTKSTTTTTTTSPSTTTNSTTATPQPPKRRRRTKPPPKTLTPPATTEIDHWFQSGPFSALPAGATPAEIDADIKRIRALIAKYASVLLGAAVNVPACSAQQEQDSEESSAFFERGMSLSPPPPLGRELSPGSATTSSSLAGFAAEPLTPESFYGEEPADSGSSKEKEKRQRQRQKKKPQQQQQPAAVSPAPAGGGGRKRSPNVVKNSGEFRREVYKSYTGPDGRLKRLRARSPHI